METRIRARLYGVVQGVFFRAGTRQEASKLDLTGWVSNREDGSVELEAQGPSREVDRLLSWCRQGPPDAEVDRVESEVIALVPNDQIFEIRRS